MRRLTALLLLGLAAPALADRVHIKDTGTVVQGTVVENGDFLDVTTAPNRITRIPRSAVAYIESDEAPERLKEIKNLLEVAGRTPKKREELHATLARFHDAFVIPVLCDRVEHASSTEERRLAARELSIRGTDQAVRSLARCVVLDGIGSVRSAAMDALKTIGNKETGKLFTEALTRSDPVQRTRATAALATFPRKEAVGVLAALPDPADQAANNSARAHIYVGTEHAYISGFNLSSGGTGNRIAEVAQPEISVLREGVVLDVSVRYIIEYETFVRDSVLRFLSGERQSSVKGWQDWWRQSGSTFDLSTAAKEQLDSLGK
jgi:hypothetical protein